MSSPPDPVYEISCIQWLSMELEGDSGIRRAMVVVSVRRATDWKAGRRTAPIADLVRRLAIAVEVD